MKKIIQIILCSLFLSCTGFSIEETSIETYLRQVFGAKIPQAKAIWVMGELKINIEKSIENNTSKMREKYWTDGEDIVFVLEQIGKIKYITTAWRVKKGKIVDSKVLAYRESRGGEVANHFFTKLFSGIGLKKDNSLDKHVDGISGATLSVQAMKRMATQALMMAKYLEDREK